MMHAIDHLVLGVLQTMHERAVNDKLILDKLFEWYNLPVIKPLFKNSDEYIDEAKKLILNKEIDFILPYPQRQIPNNFVLAYSSGSESELFLFDHGNKETLKRKDVKMPIVVKGGVTSESFLTSENINKNDTIFNGNDDSWCATVIDRMTYAHGDKKGLTQVIVSKPLPVKDGKIFLSGYYKKRSGKVTIIDNHKSLDSVSATLVLNTTGSYAVHYIVNQYFRYLLKTSHQILSHYGFQSITVSYSEITAQSQKDNASLRMSSTFHISGKAHDEWVYSVRDEDFSDSTFNSSIGGVGIIPTRDYTEETEVRKYVDGSH